MDLIYKGLLKNYSISMANNANVPDDIYNKIFTTLEEYVVNILPIKLEQVKDDNLSEDYEKYENNIIGKLSQKDIIFKKLSLLNISRHIFTHSFPLAAIEKCYIKLMKEMREMIVNSKNEIIREKSYKAFFELVKEYNEKILSTKVYWTTPQEREEYKKFWDKYSKSNSEEEKEILVLKYDLKKLNEKKYKEIRDLYKKRLVSAGAMKEMKNIPKTYIKRYITKKETA